MDATAIVFLASTMGVTFGWQPMPDGSPRTEYLVQIEPEMLATLQSGQTVPIVSDVPEEAGPIGRVRIVVGRGPLPQQTATTRYKPETDSDGLVLTQYTTPNSPTTARNPTTTATTPVPSNTTQPYNQSTTTADPFAQALRDSAEQIRRAGQHIRDSADELTGQPSTSPVAAGVQQPGSLQPSGSGLLADRTGVLGQVRDSVQNSTEAVGERLGDAAQNIRDAGQRVRDIAGDLGSSTAEVGRNVAGGVGNELRTVVDDLGRPLRNTLSGNDDSRYGNQYTNTQTYQEPAGTAEAAPRTQRLDVTISPDEVGKWGTSDRNSYAQPGPTASVPGPSPLDNRTDSRPQATVRSATTVPDAMGGRYRQDSPTTRSPITQPKTDNRTMAGAGSEATVSDDTNPLRPNAALLGANPEVGMDDAVGSTPTVRRNMLTQPADVPLKVEAQPNDRFPIPEDDSQMAEAPTDGVQSDAGLHAAARLASDNPSGLSFTSKKAPASQPDAKTPQSPSDTNEERTPSDPSSPSMFPLLLAWVLLTGSVAGNLYLVWSYLDIRGKYRSMVRSSRNINGRYVKA